MRIIIVSNALVIGAGAVGNVRGTGTRNMVRIHMMGPIIPRIHRIKKAVALHGIWTARIVPMARQQFCKMVNGFVQQKM